MHPIGGMKWSGADIFCIHLRNAREVKFAFLSQGSLKGNFYQTLPSRQRDLY
jgi:hypothetical protein